MKKEDEIIDIKKGSLFPLHFQLFGVILMVGGIAAAKSLFLISLIPIALGFLIITAYQGTIIDRSSKKIQEYNSVLLAKFGKLVPYGGIEKIFMNANRQSQTFSTAHTMKSSTFKRQVYSAYLKLDDGRKIHLLTKRRKEALAERIQPVAVFLNVELSDVTHVVP
jgi:hypothetical protein